MDYLNAAIFGMPKTAEGFTTQDVFNYLLRSFHAAHSLILQEEAQLTTLTACVVLPVAVDESEGWYFPWYFHFVCFGCPLESVQDFLIKLDIKPLMYPLEISTFSLNDIIVRLHKI